MQEKYILGFHILAPQSTAMLVCSLPISVCACMHACVCMRACLKHMLLLKTFFLCVWVCACVFEAHVAFKHFLFVHVCVCVRACVRVCEITFSMQDALCFVVLLLWNEFHHSVSKVVLCCAVALDRCYTFTASGGGVREICTVLTPVVVYCYYNAWQMSHLHRKWARSEGDLILHCPHTSRGGVLLL